MRGTARATAKVVQCTMLTILEELVQCQRHGPLTTTSGGATGGQTGAMQTLQAIAGASRLHAAATSLESGTRLGGWHLNI